MELEGRYDHFFNPMEASREAEPRPEFVSTAFEIAICDGLARSETSTFFQLLPSMWRFCDSTCADISGFCMEPCTVAFRLPEPETRGGAAPFADRNADASSTSWCKSFEVA